MEGIEKIEKVEKMKKMENIWEKYMKIEIIGRGAYADVYRAKNINTGEYVAIKEIQKIKIKDKKTILNEIEIMKKLKSENSLLLIESIETSDSYFLVSEFCYMTLEEYIQKRNNPLSIEEIKELLLDLNKGLKEINNNNIIHRDLKPSNILLSLNKSRIDKTCFKISDYGLSKLLDDNDSISANGTPVTMSPEVLKREINLISSKSDIWSLGIIIYYLYFKEYPYNGGEYNIIKQINENKKLKSTNNKELDDLIQQMLNPNINKRISWNDYFQHSFFKNQSNNLSLPLFNYKCNIHSKDYYAYCSKCKQNICKMCLNEHNQHNIILFSKIGLSQNEIKQFDDMMKEIEININKIIDIKNEINKFISDIKLINDNCSIYENDNNNNYKYYSIECLNIINEKLKLKEIITLPKIEKEDVEEKDDRSKKGIKNINIEDLGKWELR